MLVQCPGCRELVTLVVFDARDGVLSFTCGACGQAQRVISGQNAPPRAATTLPPPSREETSTPLPAMHDAASRPPSPLPAPVATPPPAAPSAPAAPRVPRTAREPAPARNTTAPEPSITPPDGAPPALWSAWVTLCGDWDSSAAHDRFIAACAAADLLPFAGIRYRDHLAAHPAEPMASRGRDRVMAQALVIAQSRAESRPGPAVDRGNAVKWATWLLAVLAAGWATWTFVEARKRLNADGMDAPYAGEGTQFP